MIEKMGINYYFDGPMPKLDIIKDTEDDVRQVKTFSGETAVLLNDILCGPDMVVYTSRHEFEAISFNRKRKTKPRRKKEYSVNEIAQLIAEEPYDGQSNSETESFDAMEDSSK